MAPRKHPSVDRARATAQRLLDHTFAHNPLGLALVTLDGWCVKVNQAMCDLVGLPEAELLSEPYGLRTLEEELEVELPLIGELLDGRRDSFTVEKRVIRPDGSAVWCEMITSVVEDPDGGDRLLFANLRLCVITHCAVQRFFWLWPGVRCCLTKACVP